MFKGYVGYVADIADSYHAERIKAVIPEDKGKPLSKIPYSFPLLPKMLHIKPKVGEAVLVIIPNDEEKNSQRFYLGPIISQPQNMLFDEFATMSATKFLNGGLSTPENSVDNIPLSADVMPKDDEISVLGRKDSEVIISDNDIRLRCGVRVTSENKPEVTLNGRSDNNKLSDDGIRTAPAFIKLKYNKEPIETEASPGELNPHTKTLSTATIVADKINLISPNGDGKFYLPGNGEAIDDKKMKDIIENAHKLPYGDVLCDFLSLFLKMYMNHTHAYPGFPPLNADPDSVNFWTAYNPKKEMLEDKLLSKDIRIN